MRRGLRTRKIHFRFSEFKRREYFICMILIFVSLTILVYLDYKQLRQGVLYSCIYSISMGLIPSCLLTIFLTHNQNKREYQRKSSALFDLSFRLLLIDRNTKDDQDDILLHSLYENDLNGQLSNHIWNKKHLKLRRFEDDEVKEVISSYARHRKLMISEEVMENLINILHGIDEDYMRPLYALFIVDAWSEGFDLANCKLESIIEWIIERENRHRANTIRESVGDSRVNMRRVKSINTLLFISTYNGGIDLDTFKEKYRVYWSDAERLIEDSATGVELEDVLVSAGLLVDNMVLSLKPDILGEYYIISNFGKMKPAMFTEGWSDNENLQAFLLRTLYDYRDKIINYKPFRIPFLKEFLQGKLSTQKAIDIYCNTLNRLIIDDRLESVSDYVKKLAEIYDYNGGIQSAIYYSRGLLELSARQTDLSGIVETVEILRSLEEKFNNSDIRLIPQTYLQDTFFPDFEPLLVYTAII